MPTTYTPSITYGAAGNALSSQSLAAAASVSFNVDNSAGMAGDVQVSDTGGGTVNATNGCKVEVFHRCGTGPADDTVPWATYTITTIASTAALQSIAVPPGKWKFKLTNLDPSNAITVSGTFDVTVYSGS